MKIPEWYELEFRYIEIKDIYKKSIKVKVKNRSKMRRAIREMFILSWIARKSVYAEYVVGACTESRMTANAPRTLEESLKHPDVERIIKGGRPV